MTKSLFEEKMHGVINKEMKAKNSNLIANGYLRFGSGLIAGVFLLVCLFLHSCQNKSFKVLPITADNPSMYGIEEQSVPGFFYVKNFSDNKDCLRNLLHYITDTIRSKLPSDNFYLYFATIHKNNTGIDFEGGQAYSKRDDAFYCSFNREDSRLFNSFKTWSDLWLDKNDFENSCKYQYQIERKGDEAIVMIMYDKFNTDVWQKFINVVFYDRKKYGKRIT